MARGERRGRRPRRKVCHFCAPHQGAQHAGEIDYKDVELLKKYVSERGKILPRRISGTCARHQRKVTIAVKRARYMALLAYVV